MLVRVRPVGGYAAAIVLGLGAVVVPVAALPAIADQQAAPTVVVTTTAGNGWSTTVETAGLGSVSTVADANGPYPGDAVLLDTGPGDQVGGNGGKPYLLNSSYGGTLLTAIDTLAYSTDVESVPTPGLAPALNLSVSSDAGWQGTLVYEPIYQTQSPTTGQWQTWSASAADAQWWFSRDVLNSDGSVLYARGTTHSLADFESAFAANPNKYANMRLDPRGGGLQVSLGQAAYSPATSNMSALVDGVTFGTKSDSGTTYDFVPGIGSCPATISGLTYTLTQDCSTTVTLQFPDGATLDGAGHTITAVENASSPNFSGGVVKSATGTDAGPASFVVHDLHIKSQFSGSNSGGVLNGIEMIRAGGSITGVTVDGITHGNGVQEGNGIAVRNRVSADNIDVPRAVVTLDDVSVTDYQKTGVLLDGNLRVTVTNVYVGQAGTPSGDPMPPGVNGSNGLQLSRGAWGSVTDSTFTNNNYDGQTATAVLLYNARTVEFSHNVITGPHADDGLVALNISNTLDTALTLSCNLVENTADDPAPTSIGIDVDSADSKPGSMSATLADNTTRGWGQPNVPDTQEDGTGLCSAPPPVVTATGGHKSVAVHWTEPSIPDSSPSILSYDVALTAAGQPTLTRHFPAGVNDTSFTNLVEGVDYTATVTAHNESGDGVGSAVADGTTTTLTGGPKQTTAGAPVRFRGMARTLQNSGLAQVTVNLQVHRKATPHWRTIGTATTASTGHFVILVAPVATARYRVVFPGGFGPYISSHTAAMSVVVTPSRIGSLTAP